MLHKEGGSSAHPLPGPGPVRTLSGSGLRVLGDWWYGFLGLRVEVLVAFWSEPTRGNARGSTDRAVPFSHSSFSSEEGFNIARQRLPVSCEELCPSLRGSFQNFLVRPFGAKVFTEEGLLSRAYVVQNGGTSTGRKGLLKLRHADWFALSRWATGPRMKLPRQRRSLT